MDKPVMNISEASQFLDLSTATINRYIACGAIPNYKVGKRRLFDKEELVNWLKRYKDNKSVAFHSQWLQKIANCISKIEETFRDPETIKELTFNQKMDFYRELNENMQRTLKFMLKVHQSIPEIFENLDRMKELKKEFDGER